jgi:hypothetical protein
MRSFIVALILATAAREASSKTVIDVTQDGPLKLTATLRVSGINAAQWSDAEIQKEFKRAIVYPLWTAYAPVLESAVSITSATESTNGTWPAMTIAFEVACRVFRFPWAFLLFPRWLG